MEAGTPLLDSQEQAFSSLICVNMRTFQMPLAACALALCACNGEEPELESEAQESPVGEAPEPHLTARTLGSLRYSFDDTELTVTDVTLPIPPGYEDSIPATKLIPLERAEQLGEEQCSYGQSGLTTTCNAAQEAGLALALLERPLDEYRAAFVEDQMEGSLVESSLDGATGFAFTAQVEGSGTEYGFYPLEGRTLLVARQFAFGQDAGEAAIRDVIESLAQDLEEQEL